MDKISNSSLVLSLKWLKITNSCVVNSVFQHRTYWSHMELYCMIVGAILYICGMQSIPQSVGLKYHFLKILTFIRNAEFHSFSPFYLDCLFNSNCRLRWLPCCLTQIDDHRDASWWLVTDKNCTRWDLASTVDEVTVQHWGILAPVRQHGNTHYPGGRSTTSSIPGVSD